ncbi:MAG TPA: hypothetical protein VLY23_05415 [Candidatus Acidoferrum sp.]|nr:hypothetical protein [Candidatus Acidoferrum sp.]
MRELLHFRFNINPGTETPVFSMTACPHKLMVLHDSEVVTLEECANMPMALAAMVTQAVQDHDPLAWSLREKDEPAAFYGSEIWSGTPERIAHHFRLLHSDPKWKYPKHEDGKPVEIEAEVAAWHAEMETPEWAAQQLAMLEKHGLIIRLTNEQVREAELSVLPPLKGSNKDINIEPEA